MYYLFCIACSAMTMTSSTIGVDPKTKSTLGSLFHEIISFSSDFHLSGDVLSTALMLILNCCQAQECRLIIAKVYLIYNVLFFEFNYCFVKKNYFLE